MTQQQAPDSGQSSGLDPALLSRAVSLLEQIILPQKEQEPRAEQVKTSHGESSIQVYSDSCRVCKALDVQVQVQDLFVTYTIIQRVLTSSEM